MKKSHGADRRDEQLFKSATLFFADDGEGGKKSGDVQQENGGQAGQEEIRGAGVRVEEQLGAHIDGQGGTILQNATQGFVKADGGGDVDGLAGDRGVRAVDEDEDLGAHVVEKPIGIIHGNLDAHAGFSGNDGIVEVLIVADVADDMKGVGIFQAVDEFTAFAAAIGVENDSVDLANVGIDAETEHHHLQQRNHKRKKERRGITANVKDLFVKHGAETAEEITHGWPRASPDACTLARQRRLRGWEQAGEFL
jgi:hypothetical protein